MAIHAIAHTIYFVLLVMAVLCLFGSIRIGLMVDKTKYQLHPVLYVVHILIFGLSIIQIYQSVVLLLSPVSMMWWIPFFCKGGSLVTYLVFLEFIKYRHTLDYEEHTTVPHGIAA